MLVPTVLLGLWLGRLDRPLKTSVARGIVSLELAGSSDRARAILTTLQASAISSCIFASKLIGAFAAGSRITPCGSHPSATAWIDSRRISR
jgi:hypothetical protein